MPILYADSILCGTYILNISTLDLGHFWADGSVQLNTAGTGSDVPLGMFNKEGLFEASCQCKSV